jgi:hypothetical protein
VGSLKKDGAFDMAKTAKAKAGKARTNPPPPAFVLDGSVTLTWCFEDETDPYADAVEDALVASAAVVPSLWRLEVANGLLMGERRRRINEAKVSALLAALQALPIAVDDETVVRAWQDSLHCHVLMA